jgi:urease accessory protein
MLRGTEIIRQWRSAAQVDQVVLDHDERHRRRIVLHGLHGTEFLLDLAEVPDMRDGDGILLSNGDVVLVNAADEPVMEVRSSDPVLLARIAWHVGNRHLAVEIMPGRIRLRVDPVIASMLTRLGGAVRYLSAPFNPEGGAYAVQTSHAHE